jgi:hypothetical protein
MELGETKITPIIINNRRLTSDVTSIQRPFTEKEVRKKTRFNDNDFYCTSHWNNNQRVDTSLLFILLHVKRRSNRYKFQSLVWANWDLNPLSTTHKGSKQNITPQMKISCLGNEFNLQTDCNVRLKYIYCDASLNGICLGPEFMFRIDRCSVFYRLNLQRLSTLGLFWKFSLYRIPLYSGFRLHRFYCTVWSRTHLPNTTIQ